MRGIATRVAGLNWGHPQDERRPFSRDALFRQVGPIVGIAVLALLNVARPQMGQGVLVIMETAVLTALAVLATLLLPWHRLPRSWQAIPPLALFIAAFLIRQQTGGTSSQFAQLALLPVVWLAVFGTRAELAAGLVGLAVTLAAPATIPGTPKSAWATTALLAGAGVAVGVVLNVFFDQLRSHTTKLGELASTDPLTGLANRRIWEEELTLALAGTAKDKPVCVAIIDIDSFKMFNDRHGHQAGDRLLKEVAAAWRGGTREGDLLARIGGDEFAVLLSGCTPAAAHAAMRRLSRRMPFGQTCSVGIARWDGRESPYDLTGRADVALYRAKDHGRDRVVVADLAAVPPTDAENLAQEPV